MGDRYAGSILEIVSFVVKPASIYVPPVLQCMINHLLGYTQSSSITLQTQNMGRLQHQVSCLHIVTKRNVVEPMMLFNYRISRITERYRFPIRSEEQDQITIRVSNSVTNEKKHFLQAFAHKIIGPYTI